MYKKIAATAMALALSGCLATAALAAGGTSNAPPGVTVKDQEIMFDVPRLLEDIHYPQVRGLSDAAVQNTINTFFQDVGIRVEDEGYNNEAGLPPDFMVRRIKGEVWLTYDVTYNRDGLLSVSFTNYQFGGGANGMTTRFSYTLDTKTGKTLSLGNLFPQQADYVLQINRQITRQMRARDLASSLLTPFVSIAGDQDFYLTPTGLVVDFQQEEYFPHSFGIVEFPIRFADLRGLVLPSHKPARG